MPCADPAVFSEGGADATFFVYCTGMSHVWKTSDWATFSDVKASAQFDLTGMSANGQKIGSWWAPGIVYAPNLPGYVMWVSVPDAMATNGTGGWDTRSIAALTSDTPTGPWVFRSMAIAAAQVGEHYIDPYPFIDHDGTHYVFYKRYGASLTSSIVGARVDASLQNVVAGSSVVLMNGYGGPGTWELNVRENPAVSYDPAAKVHHLIFSGGHWQDGTYATGHALSSCGPLCVSGAGAWQIASSGDRGIVQVVQANGDPNFTSGGPGGAVFETAAAQYIVYAAAARSAKGDGTRYLMRDRVRYQNRAPYVDTPGHHPTGL
jgi:hypothetical protein